MKKNIFILLLSGFVFLQLYAMPYAITPAYAAGATLSLSPSNGTFNKGCNFSIKIELDTAGAQTDGTDVILIYDPTRFTATKITSGTIYPDYPGNSIDAAAGKVTVSGLASVSTAYSGSGTLATVDFTVVPTAPTGAAQIKFDFDPNDKTKTTDSNVVERGTVTDILGQVVDGTYTVGSGACGTVPTPTIYQGGGYDNPVYSSPIPTKTLPVTPPGTTETTIIIAVAGSLLAILGVVGLALF